MTAGTNSDIEVDDRKRVAYTYTDDVCVRVCFYDIASNVPVHVSHNTFRQFDKRAASMKYCYILFNALNELFDVVWKVAQSTHTYIQFVVNNKNHPTTTNRRIVWQLYENQN